MHVEISDNQNKSFTVTRLRGRHSRPRSVLASPRSAYSFRSISPKSRSMSPPKSFCSSRHDRKNDYNRSRSWTGGITMHVQLPDEADHRIQVRRIPNREYVPRELGEDLFARSLSHDGSITMRIDLPDETRPYMQVRRMPSAPHSLNTSPTRYSSRTSSLSPTRSRPHFSHSRAQTLPSQSRLRSLSHSRPQSRASSYASTTTTRLNGAVVLLVNLPDENNKEITIRRVDKGRSNSLGRVSNLSNPSSPVHMLPQSPRIRPGHVNRSRPSSLNIGSASSRGRGMHRTGTRSGYTSPTTSVPSRAGSVFEFRSLRSQSVCRHHQSFDARDRSLQRLTRLRDQQQSHPSGAKSSDNLPLLSSLRQANYQHSPGDVFPPRSYEPGTRPHSSAPNSRAVSLDYLASNPTQLASLSIDDRDRSTKRLSRLKQNRGRVTGEEEEGNRQIRSNSFGDKIRNLIGYSPILKRTMSEKDERKRKSKKSKRTKPYQYE